MENEMVLYSCAACGAFAELQVESLDSGTVLLCPLCKEKTIVDLWTPEARDAWYNAAQCTNTCVHADASPQEVREMSLKGHTIETEYHPSFNAAMAQVWKKLYLPQDETYKKRGIFYLDKGKFHIALKYHLYSWGIGINLEGGSLKDWEMSVSFLPFSFEIGIY